MGVNPDTSNYNVLIRGYGTSGQLTSAMRVANRMRADNVKWDRWLFSCVPRGLSLGCFMTCIVVSLCLIVTFVCRVGRVDMRQVSRRLMKARLGMLVMERPALLY